MTKPIVVEATVTLDHPPEALWPYVADTDRLDRAVGLPPATFQRGEAGRGEPDIGEYHVLSFRVARWIEHPFEWHRPRAFEVVRDYSSGPLTRFRGGTELRPHGTGTTIRVFAEFTTRTRLLGPLVRWVLAPLSMRRTAEQYRAVGDFLARRSSAAFPALVDRRAPANVARLDALLAQVRAGGGSPEGSALLRRLMTTAPDEDVAGMRPLEIARREGANLNRTLETFLRATVAGLLEMKWELLCPSCRGVKAETAHLSQLRTTGHCEACDLDFEPDVDELIEARFYPAPSVRSVEVGTYCVSGPVKTPHRVLQGLIETNATRRWQLHLPSGTYTLRSPQLKGLAMVHAAPDDGPTAIDVTCGAEIAPGVSTVRAGVVTLGIVNTTSRRLTVTLDEAHASDVAATPGRLMTYPAFQSLFSAEALAPGIELQVRSVGLLFSDLAGSTALYERVGDARAFRLVTDHFVILRRAIEDAGGALIKTIGDAVMAAFPDGRSALDAGLQIQRAITELDGRGVVDPKRLVKVGVHVGACFAVTQNERLDYFGTAVNVAARAQHEARGGEIVSTVEAYDDGRDLVPDDHRVDPFIVELKGIAAPVRLMRIAARD